MNNKIKSIFLLVFATLALFSCRKKDDVAAGTTGSFTVDGTTNSGPCQSITGTTCSTGKDVIITTSAGTPSFIIYNISAASSGTFNLTNGYNNNGTCNSWGAYAANSSTVYATKTGTITKTGASSFTFSCTVYDLSTNINKTVTGSGSY